MPEIRTSEYLNRFESKSDPNTGQVVRDWQAILRCWPFDLPLIGSFLYWMRSKRLSPGH